MEKREATSVTIQRPLINGQGVFSKVYREGHKTKNPRGQLDLVESIVMVNAYKPYIIVYWKDFGEDWTLNYITHIEFEKKEDEDEIKVL